MISTEISGSSTPRGDPVAAGSPVSPDSTSETPPALRLEPLFLPVTLSVDIRHWLDKHGSLPAGPPRLRRNALRIATLIEYGGQLQQLEGRETMVPCKQRPGRKSCPGLMWVMKRSDDRIEVFCMVCRATEAVISGWQDTEWAEGPMEPAPMTDD